MRALWLDAPGRQQRVGRGRVVGRASSPSSRRSPSRATGVPSQPDRQSQATFFATPADLRAWLERHHADRDELLVGFHKKASRKPSVTWREAVDEALCFGWIDGVRGSLGDQSYTVRFTPRRPRSIWSAVNVGRVAELTKLGRMTPAGVKAFEARREDRTGVYSHEQDRRCGSPARSSAGFATTPAHGSSSRRSRRATGARRPGGW